MDQQQKRPREDAAPASAPKRKKHSFPLFLGGVQPYWYKDNRDRAEGAAAAYLRDRTNHDDVTVELDVPPYGAGRPKGTAWFRGDGDAPLRAARRAIGKYDAIDPRSRNHTKTVMFKEVKEHNGFADAEQGLMDEICAEAEAKAAVAAPAPAPTPVAPTPAPAAPPPPAAAPPTPAAPVTAFVTWRPGPEALWKRALPSVVVAYGGPVIHNTIDAARAQLKGDKDGRRIWGVDLPPPDSGGAPKRWFVATPAEVDEGYARLPPQDRHVYEVIDARRPCWAYFDLEFTRKDGLNATVDGDALTTRVVSAACDALVAAAGDRPLEIEVIVLASARPTKFSRHVVLRPHWTDGTRRPAPLAGSPHAGHLANVVIKALGDALTVQSGDARTTTSFVDTGVYTRDRCFRVWGSTKHGDKAEAAFDVTEQRVFPGSRPVAFTRSPLRETLVVPELQPGEIDCLEIDGPVEPPPPPPSPGAAEEASAPAAPAAPAPAGSWEDSWDGATATPLLDATALPHKFIIARAGDRGQPPALFAAAATAALAALRRDHRDNGDPALMSWRYVAAEFPSERYLHLTVKGQGVFCRSRGRPHQNQNLVVTVDPVNGRCWQRCYDGADCARNVPTTSGGVCRVANRHELAAPADDLKVDRRALLAFEKNH